MKKFLLTLTAVLICSFSSWSLSIVKIGSEAIGKSSISQAKKIFEDNGLSFNDLVTSKTHAAGVDLSGEGVRRLIWSIDSREDGSITEISFLCGSLYWNNVEQQLKAIGYNLLSSGNTKMWTGDTVYQKTYSNGKIKCQILSIGDGLKQVIFRK